MKRYSFLEEALGNKLAGVGAGVMKNLSKNKMATNAMIGGAIGGTVNKIRGGSFWKGAGVGAAAGAGAGYVAKNSANAQILQKSLRDKAAGGSFKSAWNQGRGKLANLQTAQKAQQAAQSSLDKVHQRIKNRGLSTFTMKAAHRGNQKLRAAKQNSANLQSDFNSWIRR